MVLQKYIGLKGIQQDPGKTGALSQGIIGMMKLTSIIKFMFGDQVSLKALN